MCCGQKRLALRGSPVRTTDRAVPQTMSGYNRDQGGRNQTTQRPAILRTAGQNPTINSQARISQPQSRLIGGSATRLAAYVRGIRGRP